MSGGTKGGIRKLIGKGTRLIILHAGSDSGLFNGAVVKQGHSRLP